MQVEGSAQSSAIGWASPPPTASASATIHQRRAAILRDSVSGLAGGLACVAVGHPLDTTKVWLQTSRPGRFAGGLGAFTWLLQSKGVRRGLYAGAVPALAANAAENAALFLLYGEVQRAIAGLVGPDAPPAAVSAACGSAAGGLTAFLLCPIELVKCQMQIRGSAGGLAACVSGVRARGLSFVFGGLGYTLAREIVGNAFFFGGFEGSRELLCGPRGSGSGEASAVAGTLLAGGVGGARSFAPVMQAHHQTPMTNADAARETVCV